MESDSVPRMYMISIFAGALLGFLSARLLPALDASMRRRRALHRTLFDLLELRSEIKSSDPPLFWFAMFELVVDRFGSESVRELLHAGVRQFVRQAVFRAIEMRSVAFVATYERALRSVIAFEPLLAHELQGRDALAALERHLASYWRRVHADPSLHVGMTTRSTLAAAEDRAASIVMQQALMALSKSIGRIALAAGARTGWRVRRALRRQDEIATPLVQLRVSQCLARLLPPVAFNAAESVSRSGSSDPSRRLAGGECD
jgi:hypothetical protein